MLIYGLGCAVVAIHGFGVLTRMTRRTAGLRRWSFILLAWGGLVGIIELRAEVLPVVSVLSLLVGVCMLKAAGLRWPPGHRAKYERPRTMRHP
jgi:hypothetical protein